MWVGGVREGVVGMCEGLWAHVAGEICASKGDGRQRKRENEGGNCEMTTRKEDKRGSKTQLKGSQRERENTLSQKKRREND